MVCPHWKEEGLSQYEHFTDKGEGVNFFAILCRRLLWTALTDCLEASKSREFKQEKQNIV